MSDSKHFELGSSLAALFDNTTRTIRDISLELPGAKSIDQAADILTKDDRKMYVGVLLLLLAALAMLLTKK